MDFLFEQIYSLVNNVNYLYLLYLIGTPLMIQKFEDNYTNFSALIANVLSSKYIFKYVKYPLIFIAYFFWENHLQLIDDKHNYDNYNYDITVFGDSLHFWYIYIFYILIFSAVTYLIFRRKIHVHVNSDTMFYKKKFVFLKYLLYLTLASIILAIVTSIVYFIFKYLDYQLIVNHFYPISIDKVEGFLGYYKSGIYLSLTVTLLITFLFYNSMHKMLREYESFINRVNYFFIISLMVLGVYSGVYAITNFTINYFDESVYNKWIDKDKLNGLFSVRITAIILMYSILKFIIRTIFKNNIFIFLKNGIFTFKSKVNYLSSENQLGYIKNYFDSYYFNQVSFYILNVFFAEIIISSHEIIPAAAILFSILPIMVDDYLVIHVYFEKHKVMDRNHARKLIIFNFVLVFFSIFSLIYLKYFLLSLVYFVLLAFICVKYKTNELNY